MAEALHAEHDLAVGSKIGDPCDSEAAIGVVIQVGRLLKDDAVIEALAIING